MLRTFSEYQIRRTELLDGPWDFMKDPLNTGVQENGLSDFHILGSLFMCPRAGIMNWECTIMKVSVGIVKKYRL